MAASFSRLPVKDPYLGSLQTPKNPPIPQLVCFSRDPSPQRRPTLGLEVCSCYLLWALGRREDVHFALPVAEEAPTEMVAAAGSYQCSGIGAGPNAHPVSIAKYRYLCGP